MLYLFDDNPEYQPNPTPANECRVVPPIGMAAIPVAAVMKTVLEEYFLINSALRTFNTKDFPVPVMISLVCCLDRKSRLTSTSGEEHILLLVED